MPDGVDLDRPNAARMYDYYLGGAHNFGVDRRAAEAVIAAAPQVVDAARANRSFLHRAVRYALGEGVRQFLDLGAGLPTHGSVHDIVHVTDRAAPVVYVDIDPVAVAHARLILEANPAAGVVHADIRAIATILDHPITRQLIDYNQPVCVLLVSVLHFVPGNLADVMAALHVRLSPDSLLVISHGTDPGSRYAAQSDAVKQIYTQTATPISYRTPDEIGALFTGFDFISPHAHLPGGEPPGLVAVNQWRPDGTSPEAVGDERVTPLAGFLAAVARKPPHPATGTDQCTHQTQ
ncbi:MAG TPA: SAM-dependent methyltransferase [Micromonosporaceae bacterium]|nr:SAM-dependent methyltransferase [Micromonosporaceae bacterium]